MRRDPDNIKARGDAVLKTLPDGVQDELFVFLRGHTQRKTIEWLLKTHEVETSAASLTDFFQWYPRARTLRQAARASNRLEEALLKLPALKVTAAQAREVAQLDFELQASEDRDPALFAMLSKGELERERLRLEREKFEFSKKTDIERALDALADELGDNDEARTHYVAMKAALAKAKGGRS